MHFWEFSSFPGPLSHGVLQSSNFGPFFSVPAAIGAERVLGPPGLFSVIQGSAKISSIQQQEVERHVLKIM